MHTFQESGLGLPPYNVIHPKQHAIEKGKVFWCEHCGINIIHRHFIKSSDGKVFIVGIDCLKKTGDEGLVEGVKRLAREAKAKESEAQYAKAQEDRLSREMEANGGKTNAELAAEIDAGIEERIRGFIVDTEGHAVLKSLTAFGFEMDMLHQMYLVKPYTPGQLSAIKKIHTKKVSRARVNSKAFKEAFEACENEVDDLQGKIRSMFEVLQALRSRSRELRFG